MARKPLREAVERLPPRPGVYLFKDAKGRVLYIGKAKRLDHRVRGYLADAETLHPRTARMVRLARDLDFVVTETEADAVLLESTLVREQRPHFNIRLKDDKSFPWVKLTVGEEVPRLSITRKVQDDGARYFGPFTDVGTLRRSLRTLRRIYPLRTCLHFERHRRENRPCLNYYIKRCVGPCYTRAAVEPEAYRQLVDGLALYLGGKPEVARTELESRMHEAAEAREYERAAALRDQLARLAALEAGPRMVGPGEREADALAVAIQEDDACVAILQIRKDRVVGRTTRYLRGVRGSDPATVLSEFIAQHYAGATALPKEIWLPVGLDEHALLEEVLAQRGRRVALRTSVRGRSRRLAELAQQNAELALEAQLARRGQRRARYAPSAFELQRALELTRPPHRIVCFDISNLGPSDAVASAVVAENGEARRSDYKRLRMRGVGPDDFAMMREAVNRYFTRVAGGEWPRPDLLLIDGGIGQVGAAADGLREAGVIGLPLVGLAKREETIVFADGRELHLPRRSPALRALMRLRDEAHRFAVTYHRKVRARRTVRSVLDEVAGVGPARRRLLLKEFGSTRAVAQADADEIVRRTRLPRTVAERVVSALRRPEGDAPHGAAQG